MTVTMLKGAGPRNTAREHYLARFQKQQLTEKENRLLAQLENNRNVLLNRISGGSGSSSTSAGSNSSSSSTSSWSHRAPRKGRDKGNLLEPLDTDIYSNINQDDGTRRFSKSSDTRANNKKPQPKRHQSFSPSPYKKNGDKSVRSEVRRQSEQQAVSREIKAKSKSPRRRETSSNRLAVQAQGPRMSRKTDATAALKPNPKGNGKGSPLKFTAKPGMAQCKICSRNFAQDRIQVHTNICKKTKEKGKKRKPFDASKARVVGTDAAQYQSKPINNNKNKRPPKSDWRKKRNEFIQNLRAAKEAQKFIAKGGNVRDLPPPPPTDTSDYITCQYCNRRFAQNVAERHIPKCKNIESNKTSSTRKFRK